MEAPALRGFPEEQFRAACRELDQPAPAAGGPWQLLVESMGVRIYRLYDEQSGLYEYKIFGGLADCSPKLCVDVYMDLDFRKQWDQYVKVFVTWSSRDPNSVRILLLCCTSSKCICTILIILVA